MFTYMAYEGKWKECLEYLAKSYADLSSVRDSIESERNLQGFFLAYSCSSRDGNWLGWKRYKTKQKKQFIIL